MILIDGRICGSNLATNFTRAKNVKFLLNSVNMSVMMTAGGKKFQNV